MASSKIWCKPIALPKNIMELFCKISILWTLSGGLQNLQSKPWIYINVVLICKFSKYFSTYMLQRHNNAYCKSNWRTAIEYETILNNVISARFMKKSGQLVGMTDIDIIYHVCCIGYQSNVHHDHQSKVVIFHERSEWKITASDWPECCKCDS